MTRVSAPRDEELPQPAAGRHWRRASYAVAVLAAAAVIGVRLASSGSQSHRIPATPVPQALVESIVPEPTVEPFCSQVTPCTLERTVSGVVATALADDAHAELTSAETYLSSGIELTSDSLQSRRLEARAGAVSFVVIVNVKLPAAPAPAVAARHRDAFDVASVRADLGRFIVDVVAIGTRVPAQQVLSRLAHDRRLLAVS